MFVSSVEVNSILNDGKWHHVCISWRSVGGSVWVYVDQRLDNKGSAYKTGEYIGRIGTFMIGQVQTSVGRSRRKRLDSFAYNEVKTALINCELGVRFHRTLSVVNDPFTGGNC